ncbi:TRAP transporter permease [Sedimentitalea sp. XS_ASV28]|uniref:TRAP transporter permease n=1 Tax=Sedimentitalea sp. XS_ASV28 TaxID=3241296 RepID=UPI003518DA15
MNNRNAESVKEHLARWKALARPAALIAIAWSFAQIAFVFWPQIDMFTQRSLHVSFAVSLAFGLLGERALKPIMAWFWRVLALSALVPGLYISIQSDFLTSGRIQGLDPALPLDYLLGTVLIAMVFLACQRFLGWGLTVFATIFVIYFFVGPYLPQAFAHRYTGIERFIDMEFLSLQGLYGVPTGVSVSTVFYFILFAALYDAFGGGRLIIDFAMTMTGHRVGGPAKAAVVSSGMLGSVSGSAVANVMSTGIFTIPLMRRAGYDARFAGGVEAAASTGAQLVPPVMGAAAFIMADFLQAPYQTIVLAAILPAVAYYIALLLMVDLEARSQKIAPVEDTMKESVCEVLIARGHLLLPLFWLAYRIVVGFPVENAAIEAAAMTIIIGTLRSATQQRFIVVIETLVIAAERSVTVALPCALAGIVVAIISFTGLGTKFTSFMIEVAGGHTVILLVLTMLASLVLGAGMPTTSAYIMAAILLAPSLITLGLEPLAAHFFIFYFAILSMVTPPVALAAYAAAAITKASASGTGWRAFALSLPGFVIPYAAVIHPGLLLVGPVSDTLWAIYSVLVGVSAVAVGIIGWVLRRLPWWERVLFVGIGALSILPGLTTTVAATLLLLGACLYIYLTRVRVQHVVSDST